MEPAITVESVGKRYWLGTRKSDQLSEIAGNALRRVLRRETESRRREEFWALRDVSLEIGRGEVVGLVGRNGAGKSTLLKLLARITPPSEGRITIRGRVGSLLEVGTGFHPELTGRENVYLSGAVLGMRRREIDAAFDEIVDFAGVERFLDTPVKRYSSGMYVRLAFAVAAYLEPDILLIDEVLAVGDAEFQRKCLGKMQDVASGGRTVVFVSHNMSAIQRLCERAFLIDQGRLVTEGSAGQVVADYLQSHTTIQREGVAQVPVSADRIGSGEARLTQLALLGADGPVAQLRMDQPLTISVVLDVRQVIEEAVIEIGISAADGTRVATMQNIDGGRAPWTLHPGSVEVRAEVEATFLPGEYTVDVALHTLPGATIDSVEQVMRFKALNVGEADGDAWPWASVRGSLRPRSRWQQLEDPATPASPDRATSR